MTHATKKTLEIDFNFSFVRFSHFVVDEVSISSTFYVQIFCTNVLFGSFSALAPKFCTKNARVNVDEIDGRSFKQL